MFAWRKSRSEASGAADGPAYYGWIPPCLETDIEPHWNWWMLSRGHEVERAWRPALPLLTAIVRLAHLIFRDTVYGNTNRCYSPCPVAGYVV